MNDITKIKKDVKDLEKGLLTKIEVNADSESYEVYIGFYIQTIKAIHNDVITIYDIEFDKNIHIIVYETSDIHQYKHSFTEGNRN
jgi:hypothetical protein